MNDRFRALLAFVFMALAVTPAAPAQAQAPELQPPNAEPPQPIEPPRDTPRAQRGDPTKNLDRLFLALRVAPTAESAKFIEGNIWSAWAAQGGDTATLLMTRVRTATEQKDFDLAIKLLTAIIDIKPDYVEAWNRRATLYFQQRDYTSAMSDLRNVLTREPRHFGAWAGLGMILNDIGDEPRALAAFRRAVELYPRMDRIPDLIKRLTETVDGRDL
ncbi:MAG TPA: tetratricopeptide repeat protein [Xanthobacteraceae bacterium]|nr:tetratricopeptide repeat protein [Xanthobacteraceae bacterium]